jgi:hypothetical protein
VVSGTARVCSTWKLSGVTKGDQGLGMKVSERKFKVEVPISPPWSPYSRCMIDRFRVIAIAPERLRPQPPGYDGDVGHIC